MSQISHFMRIMHQIKECDIVPDKKLLERLRFMIRIDSKVENQFVSASKEPAKHLPCAGL